LPGRFFITNKSNIILPLLSEFYGEVSEWSKEHAWKVCILQKGIEGSNPSLSAGYIRFDNFKKLSNLFGFLRRDVRAVQCACFENRCTVTGTGGSNPSLSASIVLKGIVFYWKAIQIKTSI
jgi:hypothetical protein